MKQIVEIITERLFQKNTVTSFVIGLIVAVIVGGVTGFAFREIIHVYPLQFSGDNKYATLIAFVVSLLITTPVSYILLLREGDDYFTPLRKQLTGTWSVFYDDGQVDLHGNIVVKEAYDTAKIGINVVSRKLYIQSSLHKHDVFEDYDRIIEDISINATSRPIQIIFFYELTLTTHAGKTLAGDIFVRLQVEFDATNNPIKMWGKWYDLDGSFAQSKLDFFTQELGHAPSGTIATSGDIRYEKL